MRNSPCHVVRTGATLMEVAAATVITTFLLIPSLSLLDQSSRLNERHALREQLVFECERLIDMRKAELTEPAVFMRDHAQSRGVLTEAQLAGPGLTNCRYSVQTIADGSYRGPRGEVLTVRVQAWQDSDGDRTIDADEPSAQLITKVCRPIR